MATIPALLIRGITLLLSRTNGRITETGKPEETDHSGKSQWERWGLTCSVVVPALAPLFARPRPVARLLLLLLCVSGLSLSLSTEVSSPP